MTETTKPDPRRMSKRQDSLHWGADLSPQQRDNCEKLAAFLWERDGQNFDMNNYALDTATTENLDPIEVQDNVCGTVCCALGCGPAAGIPVKANELATAVIYPSWIEYTKEFVVNRQATHFMFAANWAEYDNTPKGAAIRIWYVLDYGVPTRYSTHVGGRKLFAQETAAHIAELTDSSAEDTHSDNNS